MDLTTEILDSPFFHGYDREWLWGFETLENLIESLSGMLEAFGRTYAPDAWVAFKRVEKPARKVFDEAEEAIVAEDLAERYYALEPARQAYRDAIQGHKVALIGAIIGSYAANPRPAAVKVDYPEARDIVLTSVQVRKLVRVFRVIPSKFEISCYGCARVYSVQGNVTRRLIHAALNESCSQADIILLSVEAAGSRKPGTSMYLQDITCPETDAYLGY